MEQAKCKGEDRGRIHVIVRKEDRAVNSIEASFFWRWHLVHGCAWWGTRKIISASAVQLLSSIPTQQAYCIRSMLDALEDT